jgi:hypothetical protein
MVPADHWSGPIKGPLEQVPPRSRANASLEQVPPRSRARTSSSGFRLARGLTPPSSGFRLARGLAPPRADSTSLEGSHPLERASPRSRLPRTRTCSRTRVRAFNALTQQSCAITHLGITPRRCSANSLEETHPRHCGGLCNMASVSSVTLCRPLPYG